MSYYDLRDAMAQSGCPVCRLKDDAVRRHLDGLLWESVNDSGVRHDIREARGLCQQHAWQLVEGGSSLGAVIIMRDVMQTVLRILEAARFQPPPPSLRRRARDVLNPGNPAPANTDLVAELGPQARCPACLQAETIERVLIATLIEALRDQEDGLLADYRASDGLCLQHLRQALSLAQTSSVFDALIGVQRDIWQRTLQQLSEIIRKEDYRFRDEPRGEETGASRRAIAALSGPQIVTTRQP